MPGTLAPLVVSDPRRAGAVAAELIRNRLLARPAARLGLEGGRAVVDMFSGLRAHAAAGGLPSAQATVFGLEAHAGCDRLEPELRGLRLGALHSLDAVADRLASDDPIDLEAIAERHAARMDTGPLDLAVVGLDADGGVALDGPPAQHAGGVRVVTLADGSRALTVGLGALFRARELIVLATGDETAPALRAMLEHPQSAATPASLLRDHPRITVIADRAAARLLRPRALYTSESALVVLGHREPGISAEHRISFESRARLRHARRLAGRHAFRAVILTGYSSTGGLSEAEQMKGAWDEHAAPALLEVAGRNTAENASRSLPLVLALGDVRRVVVVTSGWHVRTPWFFSPYRRYGLDVAYRVSFLHGHWPRMLVEELRGARQARTQRAAAMAAVRLPRQ